MQGLDRPNGLITIRPFVAKIFPVDGLTDEQLRASAPALRRMGWFTLALVIVTVVGDGWSGRPVGVRHQLLLLPCTAFFCWSLWKLLFGDQVAGGLLWRPCRAIWLCGAFELMSIALFFYEAHHFAAFGYSIRPAIEATFLVLLCGLIAFACLWDLTALRMLLIFIAVYGLGVLLAIVSFPLNYLRSDMLPVILWADSNLIHHINPYATMLVGSRVYDFPYLPGMLLAYLPFAALDLRFASIIALGCAAILCFRYARAEFRWHVSSLLGLFLLCPFLQYRHDLYLQPHWLTLVGAFLLMQRRRYLWGAFVLGLGMAIYQFSWIILPFVLLNALWRRGWMESLKVALAAGAGALLLAGPFLRSAFGRISSNTVGQWGRFEHAIAEPMNLSYWLTYAIHPDKLLRLQAVLMVAVFMWCVLQRRCATLEDTLRWTVVALAVFILCNSIVDGYFFLMLLVPMLLFTLVANGWLESPDAVGRGGSSSPLET